MHKIPVILDGDPGHDDAIAWVLAAASPQLDVLGIVASAGNQTLEKTSYNALRIAALTGLTVPVAKGRACPLIETPMNAPTVHGKSGLDGPVLPEPAFLLSPLPAVALMEKLVREAKEPVTLVCTGPETNVAAFLLACPELKSKIACISVMGGGLAYGNWTPAAEFNILADPEAAKLVFESGIPLIQCGLDVTEKALVFPQDFQRIRALGNPVALVVADWLEFFYGFHREKGYAGAPVHDAVAVAALVRPSLLTFRELHVDVDTEGQYTRGTTVGDLYGVTGRTKNVRAVMDIDREGFIDLLAEAVAAYGEAKA